MGIPIDPVTGERIGTVKIDPATGERISSYNEIPEESGIKRFGTAAYGMTPLPLIEPSFTDNISKPEEAAAVALGPGAIAASRLARGAVDLIGQVPGAAKYWGERMLGAFHPYYPNRNAQTWEELKTIFPELSGMITGGVATGALMGELGGKPAPTKVMVEKGLTRIGRGAGIPYSPEAVQAAERSGTLAGSEGIRQTLNAAKDLDIAKADLAQIARELPPKVAKGPSGTLARANKVVDYMDNLWQKAHEEPIERNANLEFSHEPVVNELMDSLTDEAATNSTPAEVKGVRQWIDRNFTGPRTLKSADTLLREINDDLKSPAASSHYGPLLLRTKRIAAKAIRDQIDAVLENAGEVGVKEANQRYGALRTVAQNMTESALQEAQRQGNTSLFQQGMHSYAYLNPRNIIPHGGLSMNPAKWFRLSPSRNISWGMNTLAKSGIKAPPFPEAPPVQVLPQLPPVPERGLPKPPAPKPQKVTVATEAELTKEPTPEPTPVEQPPNPYEATNARLAEIRNLNAAITRLRGGAKQPLTAEQMDWIGQKTGLDMTKPENVGEALKKLKALKEESKPSAIPPVPKKQSAKAPQSIETAKPATYDETQAKLDKLEEAGKVDSEEYKQLLNHRDAIGARELEGSVRDMKSGLSKAGLNDAESEAVLSVYGISGKADSISQAIAAQRAPRRASQPVKAQVEDVAIELAAERGEQFDRVEDISSRTMSDAENAVKAVVEYFSTNRSKLPPVPKREASQAKVEAPKPEAKPDEVTVSPEPAPPTAQQAAEKVHYDTATSEERAAARESFRKKVDAQIASRPATLKAERPESKPSVSQKSAIPEIKHDEKIPDFFGPTSGGREPYQITRERYNHEFPQFSQERNFIIHRKLVEQAIDRGAYVPKDVLAQYPDLSSPKAEIPRPAKAVKAEELPPVPSLASKKSIHIAQNLGTTSDAVTDLVSRRLKVDEAKGKPAFYDGTYYHSPDGKFSIRTDESTGRPIFEKVHDLTKEGLRRSMGTTDEGTIDRYYSHNQQLKNLAAEQRAEKAAREVEREAKQKAENEASRKAEETRAAVKNEIDTAFSKAQFKKAKKEISFQGDEPGKVETIEGPSYKGLIVHKSLGYGEKTYGVSHLQSGKGLGLRFATQHEAKVAAVRLADAIDFDRPEAALMGDAAAKELAARMARAMQQSRSTEYSDAYAPIPEKVEFVKKRGAKK